jgi:hypothetical protein
MTVCTVLLRFITSIGVVLTAVLTPADQDGQGANPSEGSCIYFVTLRTDCHERCVQGCARKVAQKVLRGETAASLHQVSSLGNALTSTGLSAELGGCWGVFHCSCRSHFCVSPCFDWQYSITCLPSAGMPTTSWKRRRCTTGTEGPTPCQFPHLHTLPQTSNCLL